MSCIYIILYMYVYIYNIYKYDKSSQALGSKFSLAIECLWSF